MSYAPQYPYAPVPPEPKRRRAPLVLVGVALTLVLLACGGWIVSLSGGSSPDGKTITTVAEPAAPEGSLGASPATASKFDVEKSGFAAGTWKVGTDISPGTYVTSVPEDGIMGCYWARLRDFDGGVGAIVANNILEPGARGRVAVKKSDKGIEFTGDCVWHRER